MEKQSQPQPEKKAVWDLIQSISDASAQTHEQVIEAIELSELRVDEVIEISKTEKDLIKQNFPREKNGYIVVPKVIES